MSASPRANAPTMLGTRYTPPEPFILTTMFAERHPDGFAACTECGKYYPAFDLDGEWHPFGENGTCFCGNDSFEHVPNSGRNDNGYGLAPSAYRYHLDDR